MLTTKQIILLKNLKMIKQLRFLLVALLAVVANTVMAETVTWNASSGDGLQTVFVGNDIKFVWEEGGGDQAPKYSGGYVYFYNGNRVTVAGASDEVKISKVVFKFKTDTKTGIATCDKSGKNVSTTGITSDNDALTSTWEGTAVNSVIFRATQGTGVRYIESITVTYEGSAPVVEKTPVLAITQDGIATTYDMDANGVFVVYYENQGTVAAENAKLALYVDDVENASKTIGTLNIGTSGQNFWNAKYNVAGIEAGEHQVYLLLTADNAEEVKSEVKTVTFTKAAPVSAFTINAQAVTVAYDAESYDVVATLTETNNVAASGVTVELRKGVSDVLATQTVDVAAGGEQQVTLTVAKELFETGDKTYNLYVNNKFMGTVAVTFEEAPVVDVKDLAVTGLSGSIDQAQTANSLTVSLQNLGNVDIAAATITLKAGDTVLGTGSPFATVKAGEAGFSQISIAKEVVDALTAGDLTVTATVEVEGEDADKLDNNAYTATVTVKAAPAPEATFSVTAEAVTVAYGAESFNIVATVTNTSEVNATDVEVKLLKGITEVETKTLATLAAGAEETVTFTVNEIGEAGKTVSYFVQVANKAQAEVAVTYEEEPVADVIDMALTQVLGVSEINLKEENKVTVWYQNNGNVATTATIYASLNGSAFDTKTVENVKAEGQSYVEFTLPTENLVAGETATFEATINAQGDGNAENNTISKTLTIVSGETEPAAVIALNPVVSWEVDETGEQQISVSVGVFNTGDALAEGVEIAVYKDLGTNLDAQTVNIAAGGSKLVTLAFNYDIEAATQFHVSAKYNNVIVDFKDFTVSPKVVVADLGLARIADIQATTEDEVKISAVVKNNSTVDANEVKVGVYTQDDSFQYQLVGLMQTIETLAAGAEETVEFNLGTLEAGTYKYYVRIVTEDGNMDNNMQDVTVKVTEYVAPEVNVSLTAIQGISNIDLSAEANTISVWVKNDGNVDATATVAVKLNDSDLEAQTVETKSGKNANVSFTLPTDGLTAGTKATVVATVTVEGNTAETTTLTREYDVVNSAVATEPVFEVAAQPVEFELGTTETFDVVATVKNTSSVDATDVEVKLFYNSTLATQTIASLAGGAEATVIFAAVENPFTKAGNYTMYVQVPKAQGEVAVTVNEPYVEPVYDLAIAGIEGSLNLNYESGSISVLVKNNGNQDMTGAVVKLTVSETEYEKTVNVKAGEEAWAIFTVATEGLTAGTVYTLATVEVEGDATPADNKLSVNTTVTAADTAVPTFSVTAENVSVPVGATSFEIKAVVTNTSEVDATQVKVVLLSGIEEEASQNIKTLAASGVKEITFTLDEDYILEPGKTATYYVQVAGQVQTAVTVTFEEPAVEPVYDLAITSISGTLSVETEQSYLTVFVENKGNQDATGALVTLKAGETVIGTGTVTAKAGSNGFCSIAVPATALTGETLEVTATVEQEGDADETNNSLTKTFEIALPDAQVEISVADITVDPDTKSFNIPVQVKNLRENYAAKNVKVMIYDSSKLIGQATVESIAAGEEVTVNVSVELENAYTEDTSLKAWATGYGENETVSFNLTIGTTTSISALTQQMGKNVQAFTLGGQKVSTLKKGQVYIINGRKMAVK